MLTDYLLGIGLIIGLTLAWVAVQTAWGRVFTGVATDPDVLAHRLGCHSCGCTGLCKRKLGNNSKRENMR